MFIIIVQFGRKFFDERDIFIFLQQRFGCIWHVSPCSVYFAIGSFDKSTIDYQEFMPGKNNKILDLYRDGKYTSIKIEFRIEPVCKEIS